MTSIPLPEAQQQLADLIHKLAPGDVVTITENDRPVARIISITPITTITPRLPRPRPPVTGIPRAGRYRGQFVVPEEFSEPLEEMQEYME